MINLKFEEKTYSIKNRTDEFTIGEFEDICSILNSDTLTKVDKWSKVFKYLGVPEDVVDEFDAFDFIEMIKQFNIFDEQSSDYVKEITIDGKVYVLFDEKFKVTVKENALIESFIQKNSEKYIGELMAILYKLEGTDKTMWYDNAHIKFKAKQFRTNVTINNALPIIKYLAKKLVKESDLVFEDATV